MLAATVASRFATTERWNLDTHTSAFSVTVPCRAPLGGWSGAFTPTPRSRSCQRAGGPSRLTCRPVQLAAVGVDAQAQLEQAHGHHVCPQVRIPRPRQAGGAQAAEGVANRAVDARPCGRGEQLL